MEINKPDLGVFKGIGRLEVTTNVNRKFFPNVRNIHRFDLSHNHRNEYRTNYSTFHKAQNIINQTLTEKVKKHPNASQIVFGNGGNKYSQSWGRVVHGRFDFTAPPKPIKQKEEGLGINEYEKRTGEKIKYSTTTQEVFQQNRKDPRNNPTYKYTRTDRFNPITGEKKGCTSFGFEDYAPNTDKKYKANNLTVIPSAAQKYDILNGRRLTYI